MSTDTLISLIRSGKKKDLISFLDDNDIELDSHVTSSGHMPIHVATEEGFIDAAEALLDYDDCVDEYNAAGETVAHIAVRTNRPDFLKLFSSLDANLNAPLKSPHPDCGLSPLGYAIKLKNFDVAETLLKLDGVDAYGGDMNNTPLHAAAFEGNEEAVAFLFDNGVSKLQGKSLMTPLHLAAAKAHGRVVKELLTAQDISQVLNAPDANGDTPLHLACQSQCQRIFNYNYPLEDPHYQTAFHLILQGADVTLKNKDGDTPVDLLHPSCATLFELASEHRSKLASVYQFDVFRKLTRGDLMKLGLDERTSSLFETTLSQFNKFISESSSAGYGCTYISSTTIPDIRKFEKVDKAAKEASVQAAAANKPVGKCPMGFTAADGPSPHAFLTSSSKSSSNSWESYLQYGSWVALGVVLCLAIAKSFSS